MLKNLYFCMVLAPGVHKYLYIIPYMENIFKVNFGRAKMEFARIHMKKTQNSEMNTWLFSLLMLSLAPVASIFRDESFFKIRRIFLSPFLASSNFSKFRPDVRNSGRTFEVPVECLEKWRIKNWVWSPKTGFQNFSLKGNWCFEYELWYAEVKNIRYYRKTANKYQKGFSFFFQKNTKK